MKTKDNQNIIWLASYPKSGNTWVRIFLHYMLRDDQGIDSIPALDDIPIASSRILMDKYLGVNSSDLTEQELTDLRPYVYREISKDAQGPQAIKVHDAFGYTSGKNPVFPADVTRAAVYIIRNPLDVVVSYAFHTRRAISCCINSLNNPNYSISDNTGELKAQLPQYLGSWSHHVKSWLYQDFFAVLVIRYEDLLADSRRLLVQMLEYLGIAYTAEKLERALKGSEFKTLQNHEKNQGFREKPIQAGSFFREGKSNVYQDYLTETQIQKVYEAHSEIMRKYNYETC